MQHAEVSWEMSYRIDMEGLDGTTVFHLREALKDYLEKRSNLDDETVATFEEVMEICNKITKLDDRD